MPLTLDYELNDIADTESLYTRSDHYSYASKGIPIIFFTTGLHRDYHYVTDEVDKILFPKMQRIAQLVYTTATRVGNLDHLPVRDRRGPRIGQGAHGPPLRPGDGPRATGDGAERSRQRMRAMPARSSSAEQPLATRGARAHRTSPSGRSPGPSPSWPTTTAAKKSATPR